MNAPSLPTNQRDLWNGTAGHAWVDSQALLDRMFREFEDILVAGLPDPQIASVLDVGCGTGATTLAAARRAGPHARCTGLDISEPMIALAKTRAAAEQAAVDFVCADAQAYEFRPASVDLVISRFGVMFFDDPVRAFSNLRGAMRPGGRLRCAVWRSVDENPFMTTAERSVGHLLPELPPRVANGPGQFAFADPERVRGILEASGWRGVDIQPIDVPCAFAQSELAGYVTRLGPVGIALQNAPADRRDEIVAILRREFEPYVSVGVVRFNAACWLVTGNGDIPH